MICPQCGVDESTVTIASSCNCDVPATGTREWRAEFAVYDEDEECVLIKNRDYPMPTEADFVSSRNDWTLKRKDGGRVNKPVEVSKK